MGLFFTLLYVMTAYLAPITLFGELAQFHIEIFIAVLAVIFTVPSIPGSDLPHWMQTWAIGGLCFAVACSMIFNGWMGGGVLALEALLPALITFFLVALNCKKPWHVKALVALLFLMTVFIVAHGIMALQNTEIENPYLLMQHVDEGEERTYVPRIQGLTFLGDPNDFGQFMVSLLPLMFFFWKKGRRAWNLLLVYLPAAFLVYGMYLSHSRGGMLALIAVAIFAGRKKIGVVPALLAAGVAFAGLTALGFTGGREVNAGQGEDRIGAWSTGIGLIRSHPLFGVGYGQFSDYYYITAHNTFIVCAAELGLIGYFSWILFVLVTARNSYELQKNPEQMELERQKRKAKDAPSLRLAAPSFAGGSFAVPATPAGRYRQKTFDGNAPMLVPSMPGTPGTPGFAGFDEDPSAEDNELRRMAGLTVLCFVGFLAAGWFLSRAYTMVLYVNAGLAVAIFRMAVKRGIAPPVPEFGRAAKLTAGIGFGVLLVLYIIVRVDHLLPQH